MPDVLLYHHDSFVDQIPCASAIELRLLEEHCSEMHAEETIDEFRQEFFGFLSRKMKYDVFAQRIFPALDVSWMDSYSDTICWRIDDITGKVPAKTIVESLVQTCIKWNTAYFLINLPVDLAASALREGCDLPVDIAWASDDISIAVSLCVRYGRICRIPVDFSVLRDGYRIELDENDFCDLRQDLDFISGSY